MRTDYNCRSIVDGINNDSKHIARIYICATGAGAGIQNYLWEIPGCSKYFIGAMYPYEADQTDDFLGFRPEKYCSKQTAMQLAFESYYRAVDSTDAASKNFNIGLGMCGVVASTREHKGGNRIFCSVVTNTEVHVFSTDLEMGVGYFARKRDGDLANYMGLYAISTVLGIELQEADKELANGFGHEIVPNDEAIKVLLKHPYWDNYNKRHEEVLTSYREVIFPGAFNPPHYGHLEIAHEVEEKASSDGVLFTISVDNPHKPSLLAGDILRRAKMLKGQDRYFSVGEPLYLDKVKNWPRRAFVLGTDALERLLDPKWGPTTQEVLDGFQASQVTFYVSNRIMQGNQVTLSDIKKKYPIVEQYSAMFRELDTHIDISSSEIRSGTKQ